jgi:hypothetical protein
MPRNTRTITAADILPLDQYELIRKDKKQEAIARKKLTRLSVGPYATALFETWDSMWLQIQEMLRIEKGGDEQLKDELAAYDPMVPKGGELTATLLFEIDDEARRDAFLRSIGGIEKYIALNVAGHEVRATPESDIERTRESDGKASSVHFLHFHLPEAAVAAWKSGAGQVMLMIDHPHYGHAAIMSADSRDFLGRECL